MTRAGTQLVNRNFAWRKLCAACLVAALTINSTAPALAAESSDSSEQLDRQLEQVSVAIREIEQWLQQSRQQRSSEEAALADLDRQLASLRNSITTTREQQQHHQKELDRLDTRLNQLLAHSAEQREQLASALEATYLAGADSQLKLLLNQQDPTTAQRMLVYFEAFNAEKLEQINRWRQTLLALESSPKCWRISNNVRP
jgi:septal ring factor EnvC (AmiA/AmiB activator)